MQYIKSVNEFFKPKHQGLKDYYKLVGSEDSYKKKRFKKLIEILERDCKKFMDELRSSKSELLFRGAALDFNKNGFMVKEVRKNRTPKDMDVVVSSEFDNQFYEHFGIRLRSEGVFCSKNPLTAATYGEYCSDKRRTRVALFFPIGKYKYYWNPEVMDLYTEVDGSDWYYNQMNKKKILKNSRSEIKELVLKYRKGGLRNIKEQEVTFICDEYYLVDDEFLTPIMKYLGKNVSKFANNRHTK